MTARRARKNGLVSVLMFDLDNFKRVNDRFGHAIGDAALCAFAESIQTTMGDSDVIGRLGGEEFAAIVMQSANDAAIAAERVRAAFEAAGAVVAGHPIGGTVSIGVADGLATACGIERLLSRADAALYAAKQAGRNCVICAPETRPPAELPAAPDFAPASNPAPPSATPRRHAQVPIFPPPRLVIASTDGRGGISGLKSGHRVEGSS